MMKKEVFTPKLTLMLYLITLLSSTTQVLANVSNWIDLNSNNELVYQTDINGNHIMDFSSAGYMGGGVEFPVVATTITLTPSGGDDLPAIQNALDQVAALPLNNGIRGAVVLSAGTFLVSDVININASGIVLRGSGNRDTLIKSTAEESPIILLSGVNNSGSSSELSNYSLSNSTTLSGTYLSSGSTSFDVTDASGFSVGDDIFLFKTVTEEWVESVDMHELVRDGVPQVWLAVGSKLRTDRTIIAINGNTITLNAPITDTLDASTLGMPIGEITKYSTTSRITHSGIENLKITPPVEKHSESFTSIKVALAKDVWIKDVDIIEGFNNFKILRTVRQATAENVSVTHSVARNGGAPPSDFDVMGTQILYKNCAGYSSSLNNTSTTWGWSTGSTGMGPIVVKDFYSETTGGIAPHHRWSTGILVDNAVLPNATHGIAFRNRTNMGSGHGWTTAWSVAWNVETSNFLNAQAPGTKNWVVGGHGKIVSGIADNPQGVYDHFNQTITKIPSLYDAQLSERMGLKGPSDLTLSLSSINNEASLSWTDNSIIEDGYQVQRLEHGTWSTLATLPANTTTYTDINLPNDYTYTYRVVATLGIATSLPTNEKRISTVVGYNLALNKTARQSSTKSGNLASRAVDGNTDGNYNAGSLSSTDYANQSWWEVDLGEVVDITNIKLYNRTNSSTSSRLSNYHIFVSEVPFTSTSITGSQTQAGVKDFYNPNTVGTSITESINTTGRYVRVQLESTYQILHMAEVQVMGVKPPINLALNKTAKQSSTKSGNLASRAVDGNTDGNYNAGSLSSTDYGNQSWWEVDLGEVVDITNIKLYNRTNSSTSSRLSDYHIFVSNVPFTSTSIAGSQAQAGVKDFYNPNTVGTSITESINTTGRYVRVQLESTYQILHMSEVKVFGNQY